MPLMPSSAARVVKPYRLSDSVMIIRISWVSSITRTFFAAFPIIQEPFEQMECRFGNPRSIPLEIAAKGPLSLTKYEPKNGLAPRQAQLDASDGNFCCL